MCLNLNEKYIAHVADKIGLFRYFRPYSRAVLYDTAYYLEKGWGNALRCGLVDDRYISYVISRMSEIMRHGWLSSVEHLVTSYSCVHVDVQHTHISMTSAMALLQDSCYRGEDVVPVPLLASQQGRPGESMCSLVPLPTLLLTFSTRAFCFGHAGISLSVPDYTFKQPTIIAPFSNVKSCCEEDSSP